MSEQQYRTNDLVKFNYSEIGEYVDENHTDRPLRNDEVVDLLNEQQETIEQLNLAIDEMVTDYKKLEKENEQLKKENKRLKERNDELEDELEESSAFIIEQREENKQLQQELRGMGICLN